MTSGTAAAMERTEGNGRNGTPRQGHDGAYRSAVRYQLLGPLEVTSDGSRLALGGPKQRLVLAHLLNRQRDTVADRAERLQICGADSMAREHRQYAEQIAADQQWIAGKGNHAFPLRPILIAHLRVANHLVAQERAPILRDAESDAATRDILDLRFRPVFESLRDTLVEPFHARGARRTRLIATIDLFLHLHTWLLLARTLTPAEAVEAAVRATCAQTSSS